MPEVGTNSLRGWSHWVLVLAACLAVAVCTPASVAFADQGVLITEGNASDVATWGYTPADLTIGPGESITWINSGAQGHTATADDGTTFDTDVIPPDQSKSVAFPNPGTFTYHCQLYPSMKGSISVGQATSATTAPATLAPTAPPPAAVTPAPQALATPTPRLAFASATVPVVARQTATPATATSVPRAGGMPDALPILLLAVGGAAVIAGARVLFLRRSAQP
jgi:plastocyanin